MTAPAPVIKPAETAVPKAQSAPPLHECSPAMTKGILASPPITPPVWAQFFWVSDGPGRGIFSRLTWPSGTVTPATTRGCG